MRIPDLKRAVSGPTYIIEFFINDKNINIEQLFKLKAKQVLKIKNVQPKIEDGAFTWGLGPQCRKGVFGQVFLPLLSPKGLNLARISAIVL